MLGNLTDVKPYASMSFNDADGATFPSRSTRWSH